MNDYGEHRSRRSGGSGSVRAAGRTVRSIPPSLAGKTGRSRTFPSTPKRVAVQPSVCGVQPGKVLELRTTLGLMRARAILDQQIELGRQQVEEEGVSTGSGGQAVGTTSGRLKHGRLQPLGLVSDPVMASNSCLGIVSVGGQPVQANQRPRSCTEPGVPIRGTRDRHNNIGTDKRSMVKQRSYSAVLQHGKVSVDRLNTLASNISINQQTGLIPESPNNRKTTIPTHRSKSSTNQMPTSISPSNTFNRTGRSQNFTDTNKGLETKDSLTAAETRALPPVMRHGSVGMRVEVKRLRGAKDLASSAAGQQVNNSTTSSAETNSHKDKVLPGVHLMEKNVTEKTQQSFSYQNQATKSEAINKRDDERNQTIFASTGSTSTPTSPVKMSIVSLGEAPASRPGSQQSRRHQERRRRRRHSEGRQQGIGRLSQGWSPPREIEALIGSPLQTPRKRSHSTAPRLFGDHVTNRLTNDKGSIDEIDSRRSLISSPGLRINIDVNEFLQDTENPA